MFLLCLNVVSVLCGIIVARVSNSLGEERPPGWLRRLCSTCRRCQPTKPQLHREPSYLSHMQMLRERISTITAPEWMHEQRSMPSDFLGPVPRPSPPGGYPGPLPTPPSHSGQYHNMGMTYDDQLQRSVWEERPPPMNTDQRGRPNWPEGQAQGHGMAAPRTSYSHIEILISRQMHMLRTITETIHNREQEDLNRLEWRLVGSVLNTIFFFIILFIVLLAPLILYLLVPEVTDTKDVAGYTTHQTSCTW